MKISKLIEELEKYKQLHGDMVLFAERNSGRDSWISPVRLHIYKRKEKVFLIVNYGY